MKFNKLLLTVFLLFAVLPAMSQTGGELNFVNQLDDKAVATYGDAARFFVMTMGGQAGSHANNTAYLNRAGISTGIDLSEEDTLHKGAIALMSARYLKLNDSIWYIIFGTQRYAFRACSAAGLMPVNGSENDVISGPELIEIMRLVGEKSGVN